MTVRPIEEAPMDGRWLLVMVPDVDGRWAAPWLLGTRTDGGWRSEDGRAVRPTHFVELPDPQPLWSGWAPARGSVLIAPSPVRDAFPDDPWMIVVRTPEGTDDPHRRPEFASTLTEAMQRAMTMATKTALPLEDVPAEMVEAERIKLANDTPPEDERRSDEIIVVSPDQERNRAALIDTMQAFSRSLPEVMGATPPDLAFMAIGSFAEVILSISPRISVEQVVTLTKIGGVLMANVEALRDPKALGRLLDPEGSA